MEAVNTWNWELLTQYGVKMQILTNSVIYLQSQAPDYLYYLQSGRVKSVILSDDGTEQLLKIFRPGTLFGEAAFFDAKPRATTAIALSQCCVIRLDHAGIERALAEKPALAMQMFRYLSEKIRMLSDQVGSMAFLSARERVETYLHSLPCANGVVRTTQDEIAEACNLSRVSVSRILRDLRKEGALETGYGFLRLKKS